jgi:hypothetical protein
MYLDTQHYCPYCQGIMKYHSKYDMFPCTICKISQQFSLAGTRTWISFYLKNKDYSLCINEVEQTTSLYEWYVTNDDVMLSDLIWSINAIIPNLTPQNIANKISLYLTFL